MDGIGDEQRSKGGSADDEQLGGLQQDGDVALLHEEAADHCAEYDEDSDNCEQSPTSPGALRLHCVLITLYRPKGAGT